MNRAVCPPTVQLFAGRAVLLRAQAGVRRRAVRRRIHPGRRSGLATGKGRGSDMLRSRPKAVPRSAGSVSGAGREPERQLLNQRCELTALLDMVCPRFGVCVCMGA